MQKQNRQVYQIQEKVEAIYNPTTCKIVISPQRGLILQDILSYMVDNYADRLKILHFAFIQISFADLDILKSVKWLSLCELSITNCTIPDKHASLLAQLVAPELRILNLNQNNLTHLSIENLSNSAWPNLRCLKLGNNAIGNGLKSLNNCKWIRLQILDLSIYNCQVSKQVMEQLVKNEWPELQELYLSNNDLEGAIEGIQYAKWPNMKHLSLETCNITSINMMASMSKLFPSLAILVLQRNMLDLKTISLMRQCELHQLSELNLGSCRIGNSGVKIIAHCNFPNLTKLILWDNNVDVEGVRFLSKLYAPNLIELDLWANKIGDSGLDYLSQFMLNKIQELSVWENYMTDTGFMCVVLFANKTMKIIIDDNFVTEELKNQISRMIPNVDLSQ